MVQAREDWTHFPEDVVSDIVPKMVQDLLGHCHGVDMDVATAGHACVSFLGQGGTLPVQTQISEFMLGLSESQANSSEPDWRRTTLAVDHMRHVVRSLGKPERQRWVSLWMKVLSPVRSTELQRKVLKNLELLWRADEAPRKTYAEAVKRLKQLRLAKSRLLGHLQDLCYAC